MSLKGFNHVKCPRCERKLVTINISAQPEFLGAVFGFCSTPGCHTVFCTENIYQDEPEVLKARFRKNVPISVDDTFTTYQTLSLCIEQLVQFIDSAWTHNSMTNSAYHLLYTLKRQLMSFDYVLKLRMENLNKYRAED